MGLKDPWPYHKGCKIKLRENDEEIIECSSSMIVFFNCFEVRCTTGVSLNTIHCIIYKKKKTMVFKDQRPYIVCSEQEKRKITSYRRHAIPFQSCHVLFYPLL
jgi:hypothetical protein